MTCRTPSLLLASFVGVASMSVGCGPQVGADDVEGSSTDAADTSDDGSTTRGTPGSPSTDTGGASTAEPPQPSTGTDDDTGFTGDDSSSGESGGSGESSTGALPLDCAPLCEALLDGSCVEDCALLCEETVRDQGQAVADAFAGCVATEYLCFSFIDDCIWSELYGSEPVEQQYRIEGQGFGAWNGATLFAQVTHNAVTSETVSGVIADGEAVLETTLTTVLDRFSNQRTVNFFVDVDGDGLCSPGIDHAQSDWTLGLGSDFSELSFVLPTTPNEDSLDGVCSGFQG